MLKGEAITDVVIEPGAFGFSSNELLIDLRRHLEVQIMFSTVELDLQTA